MRDVISKQAAIDAINKAFDRETLENSFVRKVAVDAVKAIPSEAGKVIAEVKVDADEIMERADEIMERVKDEILPLIPHWIPVTEWLPEPRRSVIISTKEWTGEGCYLETTEHHVIWKGYRWNATYLDDEVIEWMPLPEPWKGADDETN